MHPCALIKLCPNLILIWSLNEVICILSFSGYGGTYAFLCVGQLPEKTNLYFWKNCSNIRKRNSGVFLSPIRCNPLSPKWPCTTGGYLKGCRISCEFWMLRLSPEVCPLCSHIIGSTVSEPHRVFSVVLLALKLWNSTPQEVWLYSPSSSIFRGCLNTVWAVFSDVIVLWFHWSIFYVLECHPT